MILPADYCTIPQAAELCGVERTTMWNWVKAGIVEAFITPGGHHRIPRAAVEKLLITAPYPIKKPKRAILIVDDDPFILDTFKKRLDRDGFIVYTASDGFTAGLKVLQKKPDLILLDLFMDGIDGFEVCRAIKQNPDLKSIIVIAMTGHHSPENRTAILKEGADDYLPKTVGFSTVLKCVNSFFRTREVTNEQHV